MIYNGHQGLLDDIPSAVRYTTAALRPHRWRYDFLVVTGMSGVLVGSPAAIRLHAPLVVIRKPDERSHSYGDIIGEAAAKGRYVFIDDFIAGGGTYHRVRDRLAESDLDTRYVGSYLYSDKLLSWDSDGVITYSPGRPQQWVKVRYPDEAESPVSPPAMPPCAYTPAERRAALAALQSFTAAAL